MNAIEPMWKRSGWLPELELVEWDRLEQLRVDHEAELLSLRTREASKLRKRFEVEDERVLEAERAAVESGKPAKAVEVTSDARRRVLVEAAEDRDAGALERLCLVVRKAATEILTNGHERDAALEIARQKAGLSPSPTSAPVEAVEDQKFPRPELPKSTSEPAGGARYAEAMEKAQAEAATKSTVAPSTIEAMNSVGDEERRRDQEMAWKYSRQRQALERDIDALGALYTVALSARGANVLAEVERACPGITDGAGELGMMGAHLGGLAAV